LTMLYSTLMSTGPTHQRDWSHTCKHDPTLSHMIRYANSERCIMVYLYVYVPFFSWALHPFISVHYAVHYAVHGHCQANPLDLIGWVLDTMAPWGSRALFVDPRTKAAAPIPALKNFEAIQSLRPGEIICIKTQTHHYENMSLSMKTRAGMCLFDLQIGLSKTTVSSSDQLLVLVNPWDYHTVPHGASYSSVALNMFKSCIYAQITLNHDVWW
jgi:hypothetical protein